VRGTTATPDIFFACGLSYRALIDAGFDVVGDGDISFWWFERYNCPRFTTPDEHGRIILDKVYFVK
jgi:hypothetical protein